MKSVLVGILFGILPAVDADEFAGANSFCGRAEQLRSDVVNDAMAGFTHGDHP